MTDTVTNIPDLSAEFIFQTSRSSGPGGQNVNKVNSKVELRFSISNSQFLSEEQKEILLSRLSNRINLEGYLVVVSQKDRSQIANKEDVINKTYVMLAKALKPVKSRKSTRPTRSSIEKRLNEKRIKGEIKQSRQKIE